MIPLWWCPECGETSLKNYRHLHSMDVAPWSRRVQLKHIGTLGNPALWPTAVERKP